MPQRPQVVRAINHLNSFIIFAIPLKKTHVGVGRDHTVVEMMGRSRAEIHPQSEGWHGHRGDQRSRGGHVIEPKQVARKADP